MVFMSTIVRVHNCITAHIFVFESVLIPLHISFMKEIGRVHPVFASVMPPYMCCVYMINLFHGIWLFSKLDAVVNRKNDLLCVALRMNIHHSDVINLL